MKVSVISFSDKGKALADRLAEALGGEAFRCGEDISLSEWTAQKFPAADGLVFVGAAGIAVRAIAPHTVSKTEDPAVVVVDECGAYAIPILSGHLGGANALARRIGAIIDAEAVITTATDRNGVFPVDEWARVQGCFIPDPSRIKSVSSRLLAGEMIRIASDWPVAGDPPEGVVLTAADADCDVRLTLRPGSGDALCLVPRILVLGIGCRRGVPAERIEEAFGRLLDGGGFLPKAVCRVCSIDLKAEEPGILAFCAERCLEFVTYSVEALVAAEGTFSASAYVQSVTGVDNVCERSAVLGSEGGELLLHKTAAEGITLALAAKSFRPDWRIA